MLRRLIASTLIVSLALLTPGGRFYEACAQVVGPAARAGASGSVGSAGAIGVPRLELAAPSLNGSAASLDATPTALFAPAPSPAGAAPDLARAAAIVAPASRAAASAPVASAIAAAPAMAPARQALARGLPSRGHDAPPKAFTARTTGEEAAVLFDQSAVRPRALEAAVRAAASVSEPSNGAGLEPAKLGETPAANTPPAPAADGPVKVPRALWGLLLNDVAMTIGYYMHILSQPFLVLGLTGSNAAVGLVRNVHYASYTVSSFSMGAAVDKTDYVVLMTGANVMRALLMGAIPLLFITGNLTLGALALIVAINPFFQNINTTTDEASQISILGTDERVVIKGKALVTRVMALANFLPIVSGLIVGSLVASFGATAGYAYAYAGYAAFLLLGVPFLQILFSDPRQTDPNITEKPSKNWLNLFIPILSVLQMASLAVGSTQTVRWALGRLAPLSKARRILLGTALALTAPLWLAAGLVVVQARRTAAAIMAVKGWLSKVRGARAAQAGPATSGREALARVLDQSESTQGISYILRNNVLWTLALVATTNLFLADALDFVVMPNFINEIVVPRLDLAHWPVIGGLLSTSSGIFTLLLVAGSAAALWVSHLFDGDKGVERVKRWGHKALYRTAAIGSASFALLLIPAFLLAPDAPTLAALKEGYRLLEDPAMKDAGREAVTRALASIPLWKFGANLGITMLVQFLTSLLQVPLLLAMAPVRNGQIPPEKVGSIVAAFTIIEVVLMGLGSLVLGFTLDAVTVQIGMLVVMGVVAASAVLQWLAPKWLAGDKPAGWHEAEPKPKK